MGNQLGSVNCCFARFPRENVTFTDLRTAEGNDDLEIEKKSYSWDAGKKPACIIDGVQNTEVVKSSGGQQVIIRNCVSSRIYILDWTTSATIDDCRDCVIVAAAVGGSLFMRDTTSTTLVSASTQLRLRDCKDIHLFSACESDPIIESSLNVKVAPYFLNYDEISDHFISAKLDNFKATHWGNVYDFTPSDPPNWRRLEGPFDVNKYVGQPGLSDVLNHNSGAAFKNFSLTAHSFVPTTKDTGASSASMVLFPETRRKEALEFIQGCKIAGGTLLLTDVVNAKPEDGNQKCIALLFSAAAQDLPVASIANVRITEDPQKINHYFKNSSA